MGKKLTLEERQNIVKKSNPGIIILDEFKDEKTEKWCCTYICTCGIENKKNWSDLQYGQKCAECGGTKRRSFEGKINEMKRINPNITLLNEYKKGRLWHVDYICECGNHASKNFQKLKSNPFCVECWKKKTSENKLYDMEEFKIKMKSVNQNIEILERAPNGEEGSDRTKSINRGYKYHAKCLIDGHEWWNYASGLLGGDGCSECKRRNSIGKNNTNWSGLRPLNTYLRYQIGEWKTRSLELYDYKCDITKQKENLEIHHYKNFSDISKEVIKVLKLPIYDTIGEYSQEELLELNKMCLEVHFKYGLGVVINKKDHTLFHKIYGYRKNTEEQYQKFKQMRITEMEIENLKK